MSDSRLDGVVSSMWDWDERLFGEQVEVAVGGFRIEHADGAWQMRPMVNFTLPDGTYPTSTGIFDGEDDYEGLTGTAEVIEGRTAYRLRGIAIEGEIPPPPDGLLLAAQVRYLRRVLLTAVGARWSLVQLMAIRSSTPR